MKRGGLVEKAMLPLQNEFCEHPVLEFSKDGQITYQQDCQQ